MASVAQRPCTSWDTKRLAFHCQGSKSDYNSIAKFWKQYENGSWITVYIDRTAYSGLTNSDRIFSHGAPVYLFTVNKYRQPLTEDQRKELDRLQKPSCGTPNTGHTWDNMGMTEV